MLSKSRFTRILIVSTLLVGCGEESSSKESSITSFEVIGTSAPSNGITPINANVNGGRFHLKWKASSNSPVYTAGVYLSKDDTLDKRGADKGKDILRQNCGSVSSLYNCGVTAEFSCRFNTNNDMLCQIGNKEFRKPFGDWLGELPKTAYLILEVCNGLQTSCKTKATKIILQ
jgi:hypothetical protein